LFVLFFFRAVLGQTSTSMYTTLIIILSYISNQGLNLKGMSTNLW